MGLGILKKNMGRDFPKPQIGELGDRNKEWQKETLKTDPDFFKRIGAGQAPKYLWIGCTLDRYSEMC